MTTRGRKQASRFPCSSISRRMSIHCPTKAIASVSSLAVYTQLANRLQQSGFPRRAGYRIRRRHVTQAPITQDRGFLARFLAFQNAFCNSAGVISPQLFSVRESTVYLSIKNSRSSGSDRRSAALQLQHTAIIQMEIPPHQGDCILRILHEATGWTVYFPDNDVVIATTS
ncbi:hypothetical protein VTN96DRAFT_2260 [Rasamsonia emersonii]